MENYLVASYDPNISLIRESPNANPNVYWLYSDNYLASLALKKAQPKIAKTIAQSIATYQAICQFPPSVKWKVLSGEVVPEAVIVINVKPTIDITIQGKKVRSEITNPAGDMNIMQNYADLLFLSSINAVNNGDMAKARDYFGKAKDMFDGTGFADTPFKDFFKKENKVKYDTYKLALYLIAAKKVGINEYTEEIKNRILSLQENDPDSKRYGGVYTDYDGNGKLLTSDTNTETTSLVILALN